MFITSTIETEAHTGKPPTYPYIGIWGDHAVLFTAARTGTRIDKLFFGHVGSTWLEEQYTPLKGSITLTQ